MSDVTSCLRDAAFGPQEGCPGLWQVQSSGGSSVGTHTGHGIQTRAAGAATLPVKLLLHPASLLASSTGWRLLSSAGDRSWAIQHEHLGTPSLLVTAFLWNVGLIPHLLSLDLKRSRDFTTFWTLHPCPNNCAVKTRRVAIWMLFKC